MLAHSANGIPAKEFILLHQFTNSLVSRRLNHLICHRVRVGRTIIGMAEVLIVKSAIPKINTGEKGEILRECNECKAVRLDSSGNAGHGYHWWHGPGCDASIIITDTGS